MEMKAQHCSTEKSELKEKLLLQGLPTSVAALDTA